MAIERHGNIVEHWCSMTALCLMKILSWKTLYVYLAKLTKSRWIYRNLLKFSLRHLLLRSLCMPATKTRQSASPNQKNSVESDKNEEENSFDAVHNKLLKGFDEQVDQHNAVENLNKNSIHLVRSTKKLDDCSAHQQKFVSMLTQFESRFECPLAHSKRCSTNLIKRIADLHIQHHIAMGQRRENSRNER